MIEGPVPQDITKYKTKFVASLSLRQCCWGAAAAILDATIFFATKDSQSWDAVRMPVLAAVVAVCGLMGWLTIYGQPVEKILPEIVLDNFVAPAKRLKVKDYPEFSKFHDTLYFAAEASAPPGEEEAEGEGKNKAKEKSSLTKKKNGAATGQKAKVKIAPSETYAAIK